MNEKDTRALHFCRSIGRLPLGMSKVLVNLVMALSTDHGGRHPTDLALSPFFQYQYSSITDVLTNMSRTPKEYENLTKSILGMIALLVPPAQREVLHLAIDSVVVKHPFSETLEDVSYIAIPNNIIPGNKPLSIGYNVSSLNICLEKGWCLPLSFQRIPTNATALEVGLSQIKTVCTTVGTKDSLVIVPADTKYSSRKFLGPCFAMDNVVVLARLLSNSKVYDSCPRQTSGAPQVYGDAWHLTEKSGEKIMHRQDKEIRYNQRSIHDRTADETLTIEKYTKKNRKLVITLRRYNNLMLRSRQGVNMKDKPFDVLAVEVRDAETNKRVFKRDMFVAIFGKRKDEISTLQAFEEYHSRLDIESTFRVEKQNLLLEKYQTCKKQNFENWLLVIQLALWLLWESSTEAQAAPKKWQKYYDSDVRDARKSQRLPLTQTIKATSGLFCTFDLKEFAPQKCKKGKGRQKGQTQVPRPRYTVVRKPKKKSINSS
jgi:hypothetical protein